MNHEACISAKSHAYKQRKLQHQISSGNSIYTENSEVKDFSWLCACFEPSEFRRYLRILYYFKIIIDHVQIFFSHK